MKTPLAPRHRTLCTEILDADGTLIALSGATPKAVRDVQELIRRANAYPELWKVADALYNTVQDLRHVINGALEGEGAEIPPAERARGQEAIRLYRTLEAAKGDQ